MSPLAQELSRLVAAHAKSVPAVAQVAQSSEALYRMVVPAKLSTGGYDALAGRYLHAEHDDVEELLARIDEVRERDLNAIRLRR